MGSPLRRGDLHDFPGTNGAAIRLKPSPPAPSTFTSRRMGLLVVLAALSAILFAVAPLSLSLPFGVVALLAPVLTSCDCRHSRAKNSGGTETGMEDSTSSSRRSSSSDRGIGSDNSAPNVISGNATNQHRERSIAAAATTTQELQPDGTALRGISSSQQLDSHLYQPHPHHRQQHHQQHGPVKLEEHHSRGFTSDGVLASSLLTNAAESAADRASGSNTSSTAHGLSELSLIRSEERMSVSKERVVTSRLVVRKVVTTEMVIMSVPVRRERLEVETVYEDEPVPVKSDDDDTGARGYVRPLPPLPLDDAPSASAAKYNEPSFGDTHNFIGVNGSGQEVIELLLCEERPRVEMDVAAVTRVYVTKVPFPSSQLVAMELLKENLHFIPPQQQSLAGEAGGLIEVS